MEGEKEGRMERRRKVATRRERGGRKRRGGKKNKKGGREEEKKEGEGERGRRKRREKDRCKQPLGIYLLPAPRLSLNSSADVVDIFPYPCFWILRFKLSIVPALLGSTPLSQTAPKVGTTCPLVSSSTAPGLCNCCPHLCRSLW